MDPARHPVVVPPPISGYQYGMPPMGAPGPVYPPSLKREYGDVESGYGHQPPLYPYIAPDENAMRWAFIRKVYTILSMQLILTAIVAGTVAFYHPVSEFLVRTPGIIIGIAFLPFIFLCPLYCYRQIFPLNLILLALFTASISFTIGIAAAFTEAKVIWESALLTAVVVVSLTLYTFWAARRGHDFSFLGPILFASLMIIIVFIIIQIFFPLGRLSHAIIGGIASLIFCGYIIYDTDNLIKRYTYDEYAWASVALYLDIINLFLSLMTLFRAVN
ncbi:hypothetical protein GOP47_0007900 [Adiantum capillus-veneris]|uniref:Uncharacterized protein n=1 Tax=Adiantum capillus-veneris TaxID=13818 RepID=A0A9D4V0E1_ADICA|nr:hypothetical protein GOP47_0007284 [Adiantum capillus-veneris]KAI5078076.1 hypothetical protein GOP47_0007900 [Adiantum capillus-veneris]